MTDLLVIAAILLLGSGPHPGRPGRPVEPMTADLASLAVGLLVLASLVFALTRPEEF